MTPNAHALACRDCKLSIKTYQNVSGALSAFDRFIDLHPSGDHILLSSIFCFAVVKYAKLFIDTETSLGKTRYSVRHLKKIPNFSFEVHTHLLELRNTLVAHDDFVSIEPKILQLCMSVHGTNFPIPTTIGISNKCLAYPVDLDAALKLKHHVAACLDGILNKLFLDLTRIREAALADPGQTVEGRRYKENYDRVPIDANTGNVGLEIPDFMSNKWLDNNHPDFTHIHSGYRYEELRIRRDFHGPERIKLPNGFEIVIEPPESKSPQD